MRVPTSGTLFFIANPLPTLIEKLLFKQWIDAGGKVASHLKFAQKYDLPFILLSDPELQAIQAYGVWQEKKLYGKVSMGVVRTTFIINEQGIIEKVMPKVKPDTNAAEILAYLAGEQ